MQQQFSPYFKWLRQYPLLLLLLPMIGIIVLSEYKGYPIHLLRSTEADYIDQPSSFLITITDDGLERNKTFRYTAILLARIDSIHQPLNQQAYLYFLKQRPLPSCGDTLLIRTTIQRGAQMGNFNYGLYLRRQDIVGIGVVSNYVTLAKTHATSNKSSFFSSLRNSLIQRYRQLGIDGAELGTLSALTLGYREEIDSDIRLAFQRSGAMHVLAVSGLHTGILYSVLFAIFTLFGRFKPLYEQTVRRTLLSLILITCLWLYASLTGFSPSVVRSVIMLTMFEAAHIFYRQSVSLNSLFAAAFFILLVRPNDLFSIGFQLSFAAVVGLVVIVPKIAHLISQLPIPSSTLLRPLRQTFLPYISGVIIVSLIAQIFTMPLTMYYFSQLSNYFLLTNIIVLPLAWLIFVVALLTLTLGYIPYIGSGLAYILNLLVKTLNHSVLWIEHLPHSTTQVFITLPMVFLLYAAIAFAYLSIRRSNYYLIPTCVSVIIFCYLFIQ